MKKAGMSSNSKMVRLSTDTLLHSSIQKVGIGVESGTFATSRTAKPPRNESNTWPTTTLLQGCPTELFFRIDLQRRSPVLVDKRTKLRFCSSISTGSKTSTTRSDTRSVTFSCKKSQNGLSDVCV